MLTNMSVYAKFARQRCISERFQSFRVSSGSERQGDIVRSCSQTYFSLAYIGKKFQSMSKNVSWELGKV